MTLSKSTSDSAMRFVFCSSSKTWSYSESAVQKMIDVNLKARLNGIESESPDVRWTFE